MPADQDKTSHFNARNAERVAVDSTAHLKSQTVYNVEVRIRDVSTFGFMAECIDPIVIGSFVSLEVPGIGPVHAQVRWQLGTKMGGMFLDPISLNQCEWTAEKKAA